MSDKCKAVSAVLTTHGVPKPKLWLHDDWWWCGVGSEDVCSSSSSAECAYLMWAHWVLDGINRRLVNRGSALPYGWTKIRLNVCKTGDWQA